MKVVTTLHLDSTSTEADFEMAAMRMSKTLNKPWPSLGQRKVFIDFLKGMIERISAPFEFRFDAKENEPLFVVHPRTRAAGEAAKAKALKENEWETTVFQTTEAS